MLEGAVLGAAGRLSRILTHEDWVWGIGCVKSCTQKLRQKTGGQYWKTIHSPSELKTESLEVRGRAEGRGEVSVIGGGQIKAFSGLCLVSSPTLRVVLDSSMEDKCNLWQLRATKSLTANHQLCCSQQRWSLKLPTSDSKSETPPELRIGRMPARGMGPETEYHQQPSTAPLQPCTFMPLPKSPFYVCGGMLSTLQQAHMFIQGRKSCPHKPSNLTKKQPNQNFLSLLGNKKSSTKATVNLKFHGIHAIGLIFPGWNFAPLHVFFFFSPA